MRGPNLTAEATSSGNLAFALSATAAFAFVRPDLRDRPHPDRDIDDLPAVAAFGRASRQAFSAVAGFGKMSSISSGFSKRISVAPG